MTDEDEINAYVKATYLNELEEAIQSNSELFKTKGRYYYSAFRNGLIALIIYLICAGFVIFKEKNEEVSKININNFKEIIEHYDSLINDWKNIINMADSTKIKTKTGQSTEPKVDPKKVIKTKPKMIRENFSKSQSGKVKKKSR